MPKESILIVHGTPEQIADRVQLLVACILVVFLVLVLVYVCRPTAPKYPSSQQDNYQTACVREDDMDTILKRMMQVKVVASNLVSEFPRTRKIPVGTVAMILAVRDDHQVLIKMKRFAHPKSVNWDDVKPIEDSHA